MAHADARSVTNARATSSERSTAAPILSYDLRADMVVVLASMVMAAAEQGCT